MVCFANFSYPLFFGKETFQGLFVSFSFEVFFKPFLLVCLLFRKGLSLPQTLFLPKTNFSNFFPFFFPFPKFSPTPNFFQKCLVLKKLCPVKKSSQKLPQNHLLHNIFLLGVVTTGLNPFPSLIPLWLLRLVMSE